MVLKKPNGLERTYMINDLERMQWSWKKLIDDCSWKNQMVLKEVNL